ncbi:MAG: hypothetical protein ACI9H8_000016 [Lysobacterales bacterium]|jgi:hypothetical protein
MGHVHIHLTNYLEIKVKLIKLIAALAVLMSSAAIAQKDDEMAVVLPLEAQTCNLPVAPARIPEEADMEALKKAKGNVTAFQTDMVVYRECLDASTNNDNVNEGNLKAVSNAHNYSVEMEERIAEQFNVAVRSYKTRMAAEK